MRQEIRNLVQMGPFPDETSTSKERVGQYEKLLQSVSPPVSNEEARALTKLFGVDGFYGLAFTMLHLVETAPNWPIAECLNDIDNEWIKELRERAERGGKL